MGSAHSLPDDPVSIAETLIATGNAAEAAALLEACVTANRGGLLLRLTLQKAFASTGDRQAALAVARETARLNPDIAPAALALGDALRDASHLPAAIGEYQRALRLDPGLDAARVGLGSAWLDAGEPEKALDAWREIRSEDWPLLMQKIADAEACRTRLRSDARYVRHLFDQFAPDYDGRMLAHLNYRAPMVLRELAELLGLYALAPLTVLDLGCGTGLMGAAVRDWASRLDGVDLSPGMVRKAHEREVYDDIAVADIVDWLAGCERRYDLVFAADTLVYLGELSPLFAGVSRVLSQAGHFLFTVEKKDGEGFELGPKRRWRHSECYLRAEAACAGLGIAGLVACTLRTEAGTPVEGLAVALHA
jgi:predicted TPR repeat methyltransferase